MNDRDGNNKQPITVHLFNDELAKLRNLAKFTGLSTSEMGSALLANAVQRKTAERFGLDREGTR